MPDDQTLKSYHIFMFPFKWNYKAKDKPMHELDFEERTNLDKFAKFLEDNQWKERSSNLINSVEHYNEYVYFYEYARRAIYGSGDDNRHTTPVVREFEYEITGKLILSLKGEKKYELLVKKIIIKVYKTGVAILSYHLANHTYSASEDILKINDYGRRVYPQFLKDEEERSYIAAAQNTFLPVQVQLELNDEERILKEKFSHFNDLSLIRQNPTKVTKIITDLLGKKFKNGLQKDVQVGQIHIDPIIDDRMFVLSWYGDDIRSYALKGWSNHNEEYLFMNNDFWYEYIFMDGNGKTCQSRSMMKKILAESTYDRWIDYGTLFGLSSYSMVILTDEGNFGRFTLVPHLKTMYYEMAALSLAQRASILRFSEEVSFVTNVKESQVTQRVRELHKHYIDFVNRMYFREVSSQEQGTELYDLMQAKMRNAQGVEALEREIAELHQYATLVEDRKNSESLDLITILGALFVIPSFISGFLGMNLEKIIDLLFKNSNVSQTLTEYSLLFKGLLGGFYILGAIGSITLLMSRFLPRKKGINLTLLIVFVLMFIIMILLPLFIWLSGRWGWSLKSITTYMIALF